MALHTSWKATARGTPCTAGDVSCTVGRDVLGVTGRTGDVAPAAGGEALIWLVTSGDSACCSGVVPRWRVFFRGLCLGGDNIPTVWVSGSDKEPLESDRGESKIGKVGWATGSSSSDEYPVLHPLIGTCILTSPSLASSLGEFFFGAVSSRGEFAGPWWVPVEVRRGLGTGFLELSGDPEVLSPVSEGRAVEVGGVKGDGRRGAGCWDHIITGRGSENRNQKVHTQSSSGNL